MPRASEYLLAGYTYHLTHRCHDRQFLLQAKEERNDYRRWLRDSVGRHGVSVYGYCVTSNHIHLIVRADDVEAVGEMMGLVAGTVAKHYNKRKKRSGSVWEHPYHCTIVQDGQHLLNCLRYVDMNMVRAGVVEHPRDWRWCSYDELTGLRQRYRILDIDGLLESLTLNSPEELHKIHGEAIDERVSRGYLARQPQWTESLAVGSRAFVDNMKGTYARRWRLAVEQIDNGEAPSQWAIREDRGPYGTIRR